MPRVARRRRGGRAPRAVRLPPPPAPPKNTTAAEGRSTAVGRGSEEPRADADYPPTVATKGAMSRDTTLMTLMRIATPGPEVSLNGSPTVSPTTAALWVSDRLG